MILLGDGVRHKSQASPARQFPVEGETPCASLCEMMEDLIEATVVDSGEVGPGRRASGNPSVHSEQTDTPDKTDRQTDIELELVLQGPLFLPL